MAGNEGDPPSSDPASNLGENGLLEEQLAYYRARAGEYDEWFERTGRYDRGSEHRTRWFAEVARVEAALAAERPFGRVLELACGTGIWTRRLAPHAERVTAVDASSEMLALNQTRLLSGSVDYLRADLFDWTPRGGFDLAFFGFWLSHVPESRFDAFWSMVAGALKPEGRVFFVDSLFQPESTATDHAPIDATGVVTRRLNDGREYRVVKIFHAPETLEARLHALGWSGAVRASGEFFVYGCVRRVD